MNLLATIPYHHLSIIAQIKRPESIKNGRKLNVSLLFFFRISVKTAFIVPKIVLKKEPLILRESARGPVDCKFFFNKLAV